MQHKARLHDVLGTKLTLGRERYVVRAQVGDIFRALAAHLQFRLVAIEARLPHFRALAQRFLARRSQIDLRRRRHRLRFHREVGCQFPAQQLVERFLRVCSASRSVRNW